VTSKPTERPKPFDVPQRDAYYWEQIELLAKKRGYGLRDLFEHFPAYAMRRYLARFLSHYEMFRQIIDLPGSIVELGVFRGRTLFTWANFLETFCPADRRRMVYGFDHFQGLQNFTAVDGAFDTANGKVEGGFQAEKWELDMLADLHNLDNLIPGMPRTEIVAGDLIETIPTFLERNPGFRISLLHFDVDLYEPTLFGLQKLYPLVVQGGIVCFDEYAVVPWKGETEAADEYFATVSPRPTLRKHPFTGFPSGYFVKS
jgi:hypothetical protein